MTTTLDFLSLHMYRPVSPEQAPQPEQMHLELRMSKVQAILTQERGSRKWLGVQIALRRAAFLPHLTSIGSEPHLVQSLGVSRSPSSCIHVLLEERLHFPGTVSTHTEVPFAKHRVPVLLW